MRSFASLRVFWYATGAGARGAGRGYLAVTLHEPTAGNIPAFAGRSLKSLNCGPSGGRDLYRFRPKAVRFKAAPISER